MVNHIRENVSVRKNLLGEKVMRFIHKWSYVCANYLMKQQKESNEKRRVYYYGFQIIIGAMVKGILLTASTLLLGTFVPTMVIMLVFASLRVIAGGYHMDTYGKCIATSLGLFLVAGVISQYTYRFWSSELVVIFTILSFIIGLFTIIKWAPSDTPNKPITEPEEIRKFKRRSIIYVFVWLGAISLFTYFKLHMLIIAGCFGLLLEVFTITPLGYRFFDVISGKVAAVNK